MLPHKAGITPFYGTVPVLYYSTGTYIHNIYNFKLSALSFLQNPDPKKIIQDPGKSFGSEITAKQIWVSIYIIFPGSETNSKTVHLRLFFATLSR